MKGFRFGNGITYQVIDKLGSGWVGDVYAVYSSRKKIAAAKIIPIGDDEGSVKICPSSGRNDFDLRRRYPLKNVSCNWFEYADNSLKNEVSCALKLLKHQYELHSQMQKRKLPFLIPPLTDYGLLLLPTVNEMTLAMFEIRPLIDGATIKSLLDSLGNLNLSQSFLNTSRIRSGFKLKDSCNRLADMIVQQLTTGIECLYDGGLSIADPDFHPSNLLFGSIDGGINRIYLIDNRLAEGTRGSEISDLIGEIQKFGLKICEWYKEGILLSAYYDGIIEDIK